ncbi:hypothetical protein CesoFtcFv8_017971 [Champsocephalus esox]|uniref:Uncharacterized protein n=1 Tax=Champsocephalus esox TaxID=159716 RepID=A0AAN8BLY2_9TELE|nr:hypothetical protein CesoFtcFv8_017971 [Champsocephalus esox]
MSCPSSTPHTVSSGSSDDSRWRVSGVIPAAASPRRVFNSHYNELVNRRGRAGGGDATHDQREASDRDDETERLNQRR